MNAHDPKKKADDKLQLDEREALIDALRDTLSPEGIAAILSYLQTASSAKPQTDEQRKALRELEWFTDLLLEMIGVDECQRIFDELCL